MTDPVTSTTSLMPAIFGLVGVVIGSLLSTGANYLLALRKERAERRQRTEDRRVELRRAIRLVTAEMDFAKKIITGLLDKPAWPSKELKVPISSWETYKARLSDIPSELTWEALRTATFAVTQLGELLSQNKNQSDTMVHSVSETQRKLLQVHLSAIEEAINALSNTELRY